MAGFCAFVWKYPNAMLWAVIVVGVSMWLWLAKHPSFDEKAFASAAVVEILLSTDNVCIFHQFFVHFRVPRNIRTGVLFMGTPLMVVLRGVLFFRYQEHLLLSQAAHGYFGTVLHMAGCHGVLPNPDRVGG